MLLPERVYNLLLLTGRLYNHYQGGYITSLLLTGSLYNHYHGGYITSLLLTGRLYNLLLLAGKL